MDQPLDISAPTDLGASPDMSVQPDLITLADMRLAPMTFTWGEVNDWYARQKIEFVCGPYMVADGGTAPTVDSILRRFCSEKGFSNYTVGCSGYNLLQSVTCFN
jgi:hypothetical protein